MKNRIGKVKSIDIKRYISIAQKACSLYDGEPEKKVVIEDSNGVSKDPFDLESISIKDPQKFIDGKDPQTFDEACDDLIKKSKTASVISFKIFLYVLVSLLASVMLIDCQGSCRNESLIKNYEKKFKEFHQYKKAKIKFEALSSKKQYLILKIKNSSYSSKAFVQVEKELKEVNRKLLNLNKEWKYFHQREAPVYPNMELNSVPTWYFMISFMVMLSMFLFVYRHYLLQISKLESHKLSFLRITFASKTLTESDKKAEEEIRQALLKNLFEVNSRREYENEKQNEISELKTNTIQEDARSYKWLESQFVHIQQILKSAIDLIKKK